MDRRTFLQLAGVGSAAAVTGVPRGKTVEAKIAERHGAPIVDEMVRSRNNNRSSVVAQHGMVCTSVPQASVAGLDMLRAGGTCVDAAIAANAMLGLMEPASNGIGGDLFAILWIEKEQRLVGLNASGRSPYDWNLRKALDLKLEEIPRQSPLCWNVPGCVSGWQMLSEKYGKLGLAKCLEPAIAYAREGFPLAPIIATHFGFKAKENPDLAKLYLVDGKARRYGEIMKNPDLARSLEQIAQGGPRAFYEGEIAERIVAKSKAGGGHMKMKDLADHTANWVDPVSTNYRGYDVWEIPPNGQGISVLQILNMLETFDIPSLAPNSAEHLHLFIEAKKLAFEDRAVYYADPEFANVPTEWLISKEYAAKRAKRIDPKKAAVDVPCGDPKLDSDTIYMSAADDEGNMISFIQSLYNGFGSSLVPDGAGFPIQNRGQSFALDSKHRNKLEPHKRPFHTIIPAFMTFQGKPLWAFGVMGGDFQPQGHSQVVMNLVDFGMCPQQTGDQARVSHNGSSSPTGRYLKDGGILVFEKNMDDATKLKLAQLGHRISDRVEAHGGYQCVWREENPRVYFGGSDPRKDGLAIGY